MAGKVLLNRRRYRREDILRGLYERYRDSLLILAIALSNDVNTAEDAVHDVFVAFARTLNDFRLTGSMRAYLAKCVANRVRDLMRATRNRVRTLDPELDCPAAPELNDPGQLIVCNEQLQLLRSALAQLPPDQREVIVLRVHGQMRFGTIARSLGISVNTVKGRYRYGMNRLRSILNREI